MYVQYIFNDVECRAHCMFVSAQRIFALTRSVDKCKIRKYGIAARVYTYFERMK